MSLIDFLTNLSSLYLNKRRVKPRIDKHLHTYLEMVKTLTNG